MKEIILLLVGKSGAGKSTLAELLSSEGYTEIASYTTRPQRNKDEGNHIFVSEEEFDELEDLVAYTEYCGYRYGATSEQVENNDIYVIDPDGVEYFMTKYHGKKQPVIILVDADEDIIKGRLSLRSISEKDREKRIAFDNERFDKFREYVIDNNLPAMRIKSNKVKDLLNSMKVLKSLVNKPKLIKGKLSGLVEDIVEIIKDSKIIDDNDFTIQIINHSDGDKELHVNKNIYLDFI